MLSKTGSTLHFAYLMKKSQQSRNKFTREEDEKLKSLVKQHGNRSWELVSKFMPGRCGRQCRDRFNNYLSEDFRKGPWRPEEDELIVRKYKEIGPHWVEISKLLNSRSGNNVKNRWHKYLCKHLNDFIDSSDVYIEPSRDDSEYEPVKKVHPVEVKHPVPITTKAQPEIQFNKDEDFMSFLDNQISMFTCPIDSQTTGFENLFDFMI